MTVSEQSDRAIASTVREIDELRAENERLQEQNARLTEKVQAWCPHLATSGFITGDECCDECGLVDPFDQAGDR